VTPMWVGRFSKAWALAGLPSSANQAAWELTFLAKVSSKTVAIRPPWIIPSWPQSARPMWMMAAISVMLESIKALLTDSLGLVVFGK
jgi:hypothetical protein